MLIFLSFSGPTRKHCASNEFKTLMRFINQRTLISQHHPTVYHHNPHRNRLPPHHRRRWIAAAVANYRQFRQCSRIRNIHRPDWMVRVVRRTVREVTLSIVSTTVWATAESVEVDWSHPFVPRNQFKKWFRHETTLHSNTNSNSHSSRSQVQQTAINPKTEPKNLAFMRNPRVQRNQPVVPWTDHSRRARMRSSRMARVKLDRQ